MKNQIIYTLFLILAVSVEASAWTFWVDSTNHVELAFEDASLSAEERNFIETDIQRLFAPSLSNATISVSRPSHPAIIDKSDRFELSVDPNFGMLENRPPVPTSLERISSNYVLTVDSVLTDVYKEKRNFFHAYSNAIAQAFVFASNLQTNPLASRPNAELKNLRLSKHFTPGQDPDDDVSQFLSDFGNASFHFPSLLDFKIRAVGPTNIHSRSFLWGIIPYCDTQEVSGLPIIYYQNRWWYSVWFWEEGEQEW